MDDLSIQDETKNGIDNWTKEGWEFLLQEEEYKELAINTLSKILDLYQRVEFRYNNLYYEIFDSSNDGYMVNVYTSEDKNCIDSGLCTGSSKDAIEFMM